MRLTFLFSIIFAWNVSASVFSQVVHFEGKDKKISIKSVLNAIENQTDYTFFYNDAFLDLNRPVQLEQTDVEVGELLNNIFKDTNLTFKEQDSKFIVITPKTLAQGISITGTVTENGDPMPGVNVVVKGTIVGAVTDVNGRYSINVPDRNAVLQFSFIGYTTQEITVGDQTTINVALGEDTREIEEVVVVGYGTQKKVNLTGAIETVSSDVFENRSLSNATQALQGAVPNLNIKMEDGKPSRSASLNVRGTSSIGQGGSALVLIDGVEGDLAMLNPNDIESVSVLKDAASAAIYGARGSFGVVLITTKRPQKGRATVNYTGNFSIQSLTRTPDFVTDAVTWVEHFRESYVNSQGTVPTSINNNMQSYSDEWLDRLRTWKASGAGPKTEVLSSGAYEYYCNTDWYDLLYKDRTFAQDHNLSVSGGNEKADFYVSGRFYDFDGLYNYDPDTYKSYNIRAKGGLQVFDWLRMTNNMEFSNSDYHSPFTASFTANVQRYIQVSAFPSMPLYNPDESFTRGTAYTLGGFMTGNNYQDFNKKLFKNTIGFSTSFFDKTFHVNGDFTVRYGADNMFRKRTKVPYSEKKDEMASIGDLNGIIYESGSNTLYTATNIYAEYENTFAGSHYVKGMAGYGYETSSYHYNYIDRNGLLLESAESIALATGTSITPNADVKNWKIVGTFFRLNYGYKNRYLLEVNGRYDGSSKFPDNQQFGFFPSISGGWRLSEEPFWNVNKNILSDIKFRASYGSLGNGNIDPYTYLELLSIGTSGRVLNGAKNKQTSVPAPIPSSLTWEKATTMDFGLDFGMLQGKFRFNGDYYIRKTTDMFTVGVTLPDVYGASSPKGNYADMTTRGWEITLSYQDQFTLGGKPFNFQVKGSLYDYRSKIDRYNNDTKSLSDYYEGQTIGEAWGYKTDGLFQSDPDPNTYSNTIFKSSNDNVWRAGDLKIANLNGNKTEDGAARIDNGDNTVDNPGDMVILGNTEPRYQYSFSLSADWNNFFISAFFTGVGKQDWFPAQETPFWGQYNRGYNSMPSWHLGNYWTEDNRDAYLPRYSQYNGACGWSGIKTDRYMQKVSYLRLKNLTIGYTLPSRIISVIGMQSARIYLSGENIACWSPLYKRTKDFDVLTAVDSTDSDLNSTYNQGSGNSYPLMKTFSLGISLTF
ncbi:MAG: SusC/RagA family TonB-linked outer membrane protein [Bacteroidales bacterium]|nr:SusC/RagA family TonB-linked outer membrane protein [Bacteroidales bacterium]